MDRSLTRAGHTAMMRDDQAGQLVAPGSKPFAGDGLRLANLAAIPEEEVWLAAEAKVVAQAIDEGELKEIDHDDKNA